MTHLNIVTKSKIYLVKFLSEDLLWFSSWFVIQLQTKCRIFREYFVLTNCMQNILGFLSDVQTMSRAAMGKRVQQAGSCEQTDVL